MQSSNDNLCQVVDDETIEDGFHGFVRKLNHLLQSYRCVQHWDSEQENCDQFQRQSNGRENHQTEKQTNKAREKFREICRSSSASETAVKTRWRPGLAERLKATRIAFLQFNKNPKYQSPQWLVWATSAGQAPRLQTKLIWSSTYWGIARKNFKTSRHPGFRLRSVEQAERMLSGIKSLRIWWLQPEKDLWKEIQVLPSNVMIAFLFIRFKILQ